MKKAFIIIAVVVLTIVMLPIIYAFFFDDHVRVSEEVERCKSLKIGMTKTEVRNILGEPEWTYIELNTDLTEYEYWMYDIKTTDYTRVDVSFHIISRRVVAFTCDEYFRIGIDRGNIKEFGYDSLLAIDMKVSSVVVGEIADSVKLRVGEPQREYSFFGEIIWQYPGILGRGDGCPTITIDSATNRITKVESSSQYLGSEEAMSILMEGIFQE